ncbi:ion transporter [Puniceicoccaceae bacterium K14]|nr:ion transporter [Puniceicoccaceae bacterium K14]
MIFDEENLPKVKWTGFRERCRRIIFFSDRPVEKLFDVVLIIAILVSVVVVMLESVDSLQAQYGRFFRISEWAFTLAFTVEYFLRLYTSSHPGRYARSFFGVVDLLSVLPTFVDLIFPGARYLMALRALRVLRIFRVLKLVQFVGEAKMLQTAISASLHKILVFIFAVVTLVSILGATMYLIEGSENGFTSIPKSVYWAIVTLTTVGYGDISPQTPLGQMVASVIMIVGYGIIAVPTGIVTAEIARASRSSLDFSAKCGECGSQDHACDSKFCHHCGAKL